MKRRQPQPTRRSRDPRGWSRGASSDGARVVAFLPETDDDARAAVEAGVDEVLTARRRLS